MKQRYIKLSLLLTSIALTCSSCNQNGLVLSESFLACNTFFDVRIQDGKQEDLTHIKDIALKTDYLCDTKNRKTMYGTEHNVYYINNHPEELIEIDPMLMDILKTSQHYCTLAKDKINLFMGKTKKLWADVHEEVEHHHEEADISIPSESLLMETVKEAKNTRLEFKDNKVKKIGEGHIDLGAFAKGYILLKTKEYLKSQNIKNYVINGGNSAILLGEKPNGDPLKVGLTNFKTKYILAKNCAISVSSMSEQAFEVDGVRYSHLINTDNGIAIAPNPYVFLMGENPFMLDAYSTAASFMDNTKELDEFLTENKIDYLLSKDEKNITFVSKGIIVKDK